MDATLGYVAIVDICLVGIDSKLPGPDLLRLYGENSTQHTDTQTPYICSETPILYGTIGMRFHAHVSPRSPFDIHVQFVLYIRNNHALPI